MHIKESVLTKASGGDAKGNNKYFFVLDCVNKDGIFLQQASDLYLTSDEAEEVLEEKKRNLIKLGYEVLSVKKTCISKG